jgi:hypothetical protein
MSKEILVNALEFEALISLDKMIRISMSVPNTGDMLVGAIQALDHVRRDEGIAIPESPQAPAPKLAAVSELAASLISRAMKQ